MGYLADVAAAEIRAEMARKRPRRTQEQLAEVLGYDPRTVSKRLDGKGLTLDELDLVAEWLGVSPLQLIPPGSAA